MTETIDCCRDSEATFTFNRASSASSEALDTFDQSDDFKSTWREDDPLANEESRKDEDLVCPENRCFKGIGIGVLLSILIWAGIFLSIYAVF